MRVALTGATGFIGSRLARVILGEGHAVTALVRSGTDRWRIRDVEDRLRLVVSDLRDERAVRRWLESERPDLCIHLAWTGRYASYDDPEENLASLVAGLRLVRSVAAVGCGRFVGIGTCFEYDTSRPPLTERTPVSPHDLYGASKAALFFVARESCRLAGISFAWTRLFHLFGPFDDEQRLIPTVVRAMLRGEAAKVTAGEQLRDFLHVDDVASAIWAVARSAYAGPVNIASGSPSAVAAVVRTIARLVGREDLLHSGALPYRAGEPMDLTADASVLHETIGWSPRYDLEAGLQNTIEWCKRKARAESASVTDARW